MDQDIGMHFPTEPTVESVLILLAWIQVKIMRNTNYYRFF